MEALRAQYEELGYCVLPNIFAPEQLEPMRRRLAREVAKLAGRLHDDGRVTELHEDAPLETRLALSAGRRTWRSGAGATRARVRSSTPS